ncbi:putative H4MPT-linked C1 transfer pathway protein [Methanofollis sp. W23]|uniref:hydantoinase/oxoprolinase family protein n=1 Tax=Methanofollis sp. W23 TaxID=2817849 RepID=UPI001AEA0CAA|nr:hydantoinase/oxoprolinase family protein [Methanofollis sp. W23]MBP2145866.1 putative H4MPT-linked C1 transfer pathway protein [Methanofollis sp. W23]
MIGIDIGGANLKVVDRDGAHIHYCPLWKEAPLTDLLAPYAKGGVNAAVVMSGELADSFSSKAEGIKFIVDAVQESFPDALFYGTDGTFHEGPVPELAAANWLASADYLRGRYPNATLLDVGSTTADIIPLNTFDDLCGLTDLLRLQQGYLVYTGMLRTNVATLVRAVEVGGVFTPVSTEYFACSGDVHLVLGQIKPEDYTAPTPDGGPVTVEAAMRRLARVVCADLEEIGEEAVRGIAVQCWSAQAGMIVRAVGTCMGTHGCNQVLCGGIGSPVFAGMLSGTDLNRELNGMADALPAYAVLEVAERDPSR